jgi:hypothetical protein
MSMTLAERDWGDGYITDLAYLQAIFASNHRPSSARSSCRVAIASKRLPRSRRAAR